MKVDEERWTTIPNHTEPRLLIRCKVDREIWAELYTYGLPTVEGLDKFIEMVVLMRNSWQEMSRESVNETARQAGSDQPGTQE